MNKQEVIEEIKSLVGLTVLDETINFDSEMISKKKVLNIVKQLDEPEKPLVPQCVADMIVKRKKQGDNLIATLVNLGAFGDALRWIRKGDNGDTFAKAWLFGYEIEKEKLYTVEIPNPNEPDSGHIVLHKDEHNKVYIDWHYEDDWKLLKSLKLTEAEIKKDFEWAWQFAEEVEE